MKTEQAYTETMDLNVKTFGGRMSDEELADAIAPGDPKRLKIVASLTPERRAALEQLIWVGEELNAGRPPKGVIVCR